MNATECPVCGEPPEIEQQSRYPKLPYPVWICTHTCRAAHPHFYIELSDDFKTELDAYLAWDCLLAKLTAKKP